MNALEARGIELAWDSTGDGSPEVVLVHETATTSAAWTRVADAVAGSGARAIAYDRRGWGSSTAPDDYRRTTVEEQSEDLAELIGAATGGPVIACGAGLGAVIALDLMIRRPELVAGGVLVEPLLPGLVPDATGLLSDDREAIASAVQEEGVDGVVTSYLSGGLPGLGPGAERLPAELSDAARERPRSLVAELGAAAGWSMPVHRLGSVELPVALLCSEGTPAPLLAAAGALDARLVNADTDRLPGAGPPHLTAADPVASAALGVVV